MSELEIDLDLRYLSGLALIYVDIIYIDNCLCIRHITSNAWHV